MDTLKIPESGLLLDGPNSSESKVPPQAFPVALNDSVIEGLVNCVRDGGNVELSLGNKPTLTYGSSSHRIEPSNDSLPYDVYLTKPYEDNRRAVRLPNTSSIFIKPKKPALPTKSQVNTSEKTGTGKPKSGPSSKSSTSPGLDSDIEALQNGFAAHDAARERAHVVEGLAPSKKAATKSKGKLLHGNFPRRKSVSTSPSLKPVPSPAATPVLSASQQAMERAKELRFALVHELAVKSQPKSELKKKWDGSSEDLDRTLSKVGDYDDDAQTWSLRKTYWKELDVYNYDYNSQEDRQTAIDNAIRQYDRQRLSSSEPEWQKLLPVEERGQGICLSRLQASLARGPTKPAPKIKVQKADDSSTSKDDDESMGSEKAGGEAMARSGSNTSISKSRKPNGQDAQTKRLLGKTKSKPAVTPKPVATPKPATQKPSPTKPKVGAPKSNGGRVLSQAIIENSDSSGDEAPRLQKAKPQHRPTPQPKTSSTASPRIPSKEPVKSQQQSSKRSRSEYDMDDSSSSSGTPLARRLPQKPVRPVKPLPSRSADSTQNSQRNASNAAPTKNRNTSPTKSSPLASSPPTNASDMEVAKPTITKKRKAVEDEKPSSKRQAVGTVPSNVMRQAQKFKLYYQKYEALHWEVSGLDNPPDSKLADLLDMRDRLAGMKKDIYKQCAAA